MSLRIVSALTIVLMTLGCSPATGGGDPGDGDGGGNTSSTVRLTVNLEPSEGGQVSPGSGTFEKGSSVELEAAASEGWDFTEWMGDLATDTNPITITLNDDTEITAHFQRQVASFIMELESSDGKNAQQLKLGMVDGASGSFDENLDKKAPPKPPSGSFYSHIVNGDQLLLTDLREISEAEKIWTIEFSAEDDRVVTLNWELVEGDIVGSLQLTDDADNPQSVNIDMSQQDQFEIIDTAVNRLFVVYSRN